MTDIEDAVERVRAWAASRQIDPDVAVDAGVEVDDEDGVLVVRYPYIDEEGVVLHWRARAVAAGADGRRYAETIPGPGDDTSGRLFAPTSSGDVLVIAEGEPDTLSAITAGFAAVGLPGASTVEALAPDVQTFAKNFETVIVVMQGDAPGREAAREVVRALRGHRGLKLVTDWKVDDSDLNDVLRDGGVDAVVELLTSAIDIPPGLAVKGPTHWLDTAPVVVDDWVVEHVARPGQVVLVAGAPGAKKSLISALLAICMSIGATWLGLKVRRGRVLWVDAAEMGPDNAPRFWALLAGQDVNREDFNVDMSDDNSFRLDDDRGLRDLADTLRLARAGGRPYTMVVIDALSSVLAGTDENNPGAMNAALGALRDFAATHGVVIWLIHHEGKPGDGRTALSRVRGTTAITARVNTVISLFDVPNTENTTIKVTKSRFRKPPAKTFCVDDIEGAIVVREVETKATPEAVPVLGPDGATLTPLQARLLDHLVANGPTPDSELRKLPGASSGTDRSDALKDLATRAVITKDDATRKWTAVVPSPEPSAP